jgi:hypothetical protein
LLTFPNFKNVKDLLKSYNKNYKLTLIITITRPFKTYKGASVKRKLRRPLNKKKGLRRPR